MIRTRRLLLREWRDDDREPFAALNADPVVMEHFPTTLTRAQSDAYVDRAAAHLAEHGYGLWAVEADGAFAGSAGLRWCDVLGSRELEVAWRLARPYWGRGLASEAATTALSYGLAHVSRVVSFTAVVNTRSEALMRRTGMVRERVFDHPREDLGRLRPHVLYAAERQTWRPHSVF